MNGRTTQLYVNPSTFTPCRVVPTIVLAPLTPPSPWEGTTFQLNPAEQEYVEKESFYYRHFLAFGRWRPLILYSVHTFAQVPYGVVHHASRCYLANPLIQYV